VLKAVRAWDTRQDLAAGYIAPSEPAVFFIEGPAGTGKTTTYKAICDMTEARGKTVLCMAFTGSAACLLPNGRTCHNALKLPVPLNEDSISGLEFGFEQ
jgi:PIF1-like helicase